MKTVATTLIAFSLIAGSKAALADQSSVPPDYHYHAGSDSGKHTFTLGYAQSHVKRFKDMKGFNFKYHYEIPELPLSAVASLTWMNTRGSQSQHFDETAEEDHHRVRYYSLMVGPAYRVATWASIYLLAGAGWESSSNKNEYYSPSGDRSGHYKVFDARFAWGTGMQFNLIDNVVLDVGYQAGHVQKTSSNGFTVGVGYQF